MLVALVKYTFFLPIFIPFAKTINVTMKIHNVSVHDDSWITWSNPWTLYTELSNGESLRSNHRSLTKTATTSPIIVTTTFNKRKAFVQYWYYQIACSNVQWLYHRNPNNLQAICRHIVRFIEYKYCVYSKRYYNLLQIVWSVIFINFSKLLYVLFCRQHNSRISHNHIKILIVSLDSPTIQSFCIYTTSFYNYLTNAIPSMCLFPFCCNCCLLLMKDSFSFPQQRQRNDNNDEYHLRRTIRTFLPEDQHGTNDDLCEE